MQKRQSCAFSHPSSEAPKAVFEVFYMQIEIRVGNSVLAGNLAMRKAEILRATEPSGQPWSQSTKAPKVFEVLYRQTM